MKSKLVILRGRPTAGKSTAFTNLRKRNEFEGWVFVNFPQIKSWFKHVSDSRELKKQTLFIVLKELMKTKKNIIFEEMSRETVMKYLGKEVKKYGYKFVIFQFTVKTTTSYKRNITRSKAKLHPKLGKRQMNKLHKMHDDTLDKKATLIDTNKLGQRAVVNLILEELKLK